MHEYWMKTERTGFGSWQEGDDDSAFLLWGDPAVSRYISRTGVFTEEEILQRLQTEIRNQELYGIQYWPFFDLKDNELIGCCGLRPHQETYELGFHLRPSYRHRGYAFEAAKAVIRHAFETLHADVLSAGHHPENRASEKLLKKLGFVQTGKEYYEPTGLYHPSYVLNRNEWQRRQLKDENH